MKKTLLLALLALPMMFAACSDDEEKDPPEQKHTLVGNWLLTKNVAKVEAADAAVKAEIERKINHVPTYPSYRTFNADGTGVDTDIYDADKEEISKFTYSINDNIVTITYVEIDESGPDIEVVRFLVSATGLDLTSADNEDLEYYKELHPNAGITLVEDHEIFAKVASIEKPKPIAAPIVGSWKMLKVEAKVEAGDATVKEAIEKEIFREKDYEYYTFNADGTGLSIWDNGEDKAPFVYTIADNVVTIVVAATDEEIENTQVYKYVIENNTLIFTDPKDIEYRTKKYQDKFPNGKVTSVNTLAVYGKVATVEKPNVLSIVGTWTAKITDAKATVLTNYADKRKLYEDAVIDSQGYETTTFTFTADNKFTSEEIDLDGEVETYTGTYTRNGTDLYLTLDVEDSSAQYSTVVITREGMTIQPKYTDILIKEMISNSMLITEPLPKDLEIYYNSPLVVKFVKK